MQSSAKRHKMTRSESFSLHLGLTSKKQFMMRTGMPIKTTAQTLEHIKKQRVRSHQKISFSIRKMDEMFRPLRKNPEQTSPEPVKTSCMARQKINFAANKVEKIKTLMNFYEPIKFKKNIITQQGQSEKQERSKRIKTEYVQEVQEAGTTQGPFFNTSTHNQQCFFPIRTSLLRNSTHEDEFFVNKGIPGVKFKQRHYSPSKTVSTSIPMKTSLGSLRKSNQRYEGTTTTKKLSYLHAEDLLDRDEDQRVQKMYQLRGEHRLFEEPKQWQFYDCLKLSQLSLYRSNLKLSCQNWVLIDYLELKYIRGWHPQEVKQLKIANILFAISILMSLQQSGLDCQRLKVRINQKIVEKKLLTGKNPVHSLQNNTILSLWDLFIGLIYTGQIDLLWNIIYIEACIHKKYNVHLQGWAQDLQEYEEYIFLEDLSQLQQYQEIFITLCEQICDRLKINKFSIENRKRRKGSVNRDDVYGLGSKSAEFILCKANCVQAAILFMQCIKYPSFYKIFTNPLDFIKVNIHYQVGNHFWQPRVHSWRRNIDGKRDQYYLIDQNRGNLQHSVVSYNKKENVIMILNDCKVNMAARDCQSINKWMKDSVKRFQNIKN